MQCVKVTETAYESSRSMRADKIFLLGDVPDFRQRWRPLQR